MKREGEESEQHDDGNDTDVRIFLISLALAVVYG